MPLVLEDEAKSPTGFDVLTANTLFWKTVPVLLKQQDREDQFEELTFRILTGFGRQNHSLRILRIHISSEADSYFLHSLEVSEEDFQSLKTEQGILVDFASFPGKIISLLEKCIGVQPVDSPRFQAVLTARGGESLFKIVETNDFKQLPHITLAFRPGNDGVVKQFLAFRLTEVKGNCQDLTEELNRTKEDRDATNQQLQTYKQQFTELKEQYDKHILEVQANAKTQQATSHEEKLREKSQLKDQFERERSEMEKRFAEQSSTMNTRISELDTESRKLREIKYELDTKVSELSHRLGTAEGSNKSLEEEATRLRALNQQLNLAKHEQDIQLNEAKAKLIALEEKVHAQAEIIEQQKSRLKDLETASRQWESRCNDLREVAAGHDARAKDAQAEVLKGNQIIEKLSNDMKVSREKVKRKVAIITRQEEDLQHQEAALAAKQREVQTLSQALESLRMEVSSFSSENAELKAKLEDSKQQLQSNEQMIRWLNQQVTDAQLSGTGAVPGSRYSFRPAITAGPSAAAAGLPTSAAATPGVGLLSGPGTSYTSKYSSAYGLAGGAGGSSTSFGTSSGFSGSAALKSAYLPMSPNQLTTPGYQKSSVDLGGQAQYMSSQSMAGEGAPPPIGGSRYTSVVGYGGSVGAGHGAAGGGASQPQRL